MYVPSLSPTTGPAESPPDPFPDRFDPYYRHSEDLRLLRKTTKAQRNSCFHGWHPPHPDPLAPNRISDRALWYICPLWRFLRNHRILRRQYPYCGPIYTNVAAKDILWKKERRIASMKVYTIGRHLILSAFYQPLLEWNVTLEGIIIFIPTVHL